FIWNIIQHQEIELLMKKLPQNMLLKHYSLDEVIAEAILCNIKIKEEVSADIVSAYLKAIFMNMLHVEVIGEEQFDDVLKLLIKGLAQQIVKEG
ncbi:MAG: TetR/AcrR family transcriptional regulator, partial [Tetragenococcus sp.]|nr:TetR/AcrR family transcriptional regulator [Tetragenococcus sp.]